MTGFLAVRSEYENMFLPQINRFNFLCFNRIDIVYIIVFALQMAFLVAICRANDFNSAFNAPWLFYRGTFRRLEIIRFLLLLH